VDFQNLEKTFLFSHFLDLRSLWLRVITAQMQTAHPLLSRLRSGLVAAQIIFWISSVSNHALSRSHIGKGFDPREIVEKGPPALLRAGASFQPAVHSRMVATVPSGPSVDHAFHSGDLFAQRIFRAFNSLRSAKPAPF
jgi:hypothetical protein